MPETRLKPVIDRAEIGPHTHVLPSPISEGAPTTDWRLRLPVLIGERVRLRELRLSDAAPLLSMLASHEITRFISPPPTTREGYERFIDWALRQRTAGKHAGFAVTLHDSEIPVGIFQVTQLAGSFETAEWGFVIEPAFWGAGLFLEGAQLLLDFVFNTIGVHRLEARAAILNGRGNGALLKVGAVQEGILRKAFLRNGRAFDQVLYSILRDDWRVSRVAPRLVHHPRVH